MNKELEKLSFEQAFEALETAVHRLEAGDLTLEEAIALYQRGMGLAQRCTDALDTAELQVQELAVSGDATEAGS